MAYFLLRCPPDDLPGLVENGLAFKFRRFQQSDLGKLLLDSFSPVKYCPFVEGELDLRPRGTWL